MERLILGFVAGLIVSSMYERNLLKWLSFERTREQIKSLPAR